jgi:hypothetical protein
LPRLFFFGGATLHDFSFALLIGMAVDPILPSFVASPLLAIQMDNSQVNPRILPSNISSPLAITGRSLLPVTPGYPVSPSAAGNWTSP